MAVSILQETPFETKETHSTRFQGKLQRFNPSMPWGHPIRQFANSLPRFRGINHRFHTPGEFSADLSKTFPTPGVFPIHQQNHQLSKQGRGIPRCMLPRSSCEQPLRGLPSATNRSCHRVCLRFSPVTFGGFPGTTQTFSIGRNRGE